MFDVRRSPELQAAILGMRQSERDVRLNINAEARKRIKPVWNEGLRGHAETRGEIRVLVQGNRVAAGARNIKVTAATSTRPLSGGLVPTDNWAPFEFGARTRKKTFTTTSTKGKKFTVTRTVGRQFRPRVKHGRVIFAAASATGTEIVRIWVRTIVDGLVINAGMKAGK